MAWASVVVQRGTEWLRKSSRQERNSNRGEERVSQYDSVGELGELESQYSRHIPVAM